MEQGGLRQGGGILIASAEKMRKRTTAPRPLDKVRSYGQIVGHVADAQYVFCSMASAERALISKSSRARHRRLI